MLAVRVAAIALVLAMLPRIDWAQRPEVRVIDTVTVSEMPTVTVPDTRRVWDYTIPDSVIARTLRLLGSQIPFEGAVCFYGRIERVEVSANMPGPWFRVAVEAVAPAAVKSATTNSVAFADTPDQRHGCQSRPDLVGVGHSHWYARCNVAESPSNVDMYLLLDDKRVLFSSAWCFDGGVVIGWQDGQRTRVEYLTPEGRIRRR